VARVSDPRAAQPLLLPLLLPLILPLLLSLILSLILPWILPWKRRALARRIIRAFMTFPSPL
jgi:hypothetical protein